MKRVGILVLSISLSLTPLYASTQSNQLDIDALMRKIPDRCLEYASVVAEAELAKSKNSPNYHQEMLTSDGYKTEVKLLQHRCISVEYILILRTLKSSIPSKDAERMNIDQSIKAQMKIIEKTL